VKRAVVLLALAACRPASDFVPPDFSGDTIDFGTSRTLANFAKHDLSKY
jgi:hypothetical protein